MSESRIASLTAVIGEDGYIWSAPHGDRAREARKFVGAAVADQATQRFAVLTAKST